MRIGRADLSAAVILLPLPSAAMVLCQGRDRHTCVVDGDTVWIEGEKIRLADIDAREIAGNHMVYTVFLSRYEETAAQREEAETYRVVITTEEAFLQFVKSWAKWIGSLDLDRRLAAAA